MKSIITAVLCFSCPLLFAQQAPAPAPPQQPPTSAATPADKPPPDVDTQGAVTIFYWLAGGPLQLTGGKKNTSTLPGGGDLPYPDANRRAPGGILSFPAGKFNRLEISYLQTNGTGNQIASQNLEIFGQNLPKGDYLATQFRLQNFKFSWNYLTWPSPPEDAKLRIKTLWEVQYTKIASTVDTPFETNVSVSTAFATKTIFYPTFGLGADYFASKRFHMEARASGFGLPHKSVLWDAQASAVARFGHVEIFAGYKAYHFKTSPNSDNYITGTLKGPWGGLRWVF